MARGVGAAANALPARPPPPVPSSLPRQRGARSLPISRRDRQQPRPQPQLRRVHRHRRMRRATCPSFRLFLYRGRPRSNLSLNRGRLPALTVSLAHRLRTRQGQRAASRLPQWPHRRIQLPSGRLRQPALRPWGQRPLKVATRRHHTRQNRRHCPSSPIRPHLRPRPPRRPPPLRLSASCWSISGCLRRSRSPLCCACPQPQVRRWCLGCGGWGRRWEACQAMWEAGGCRCC
jgi:hypothetical protein